MTETTVLKATAPVLCGVTYHIKLAIEMGEIIPLTPVFS